MASFLAPSASASGCQQTEKVHEQLNEDVYFNCPKI